MVGGEFRFDVFVDKDSIRKKNQISLKIEGWIGGQGRGQYSSQGQLSVDRPLGRSGFRYAELDVCF